MTKLRHVDDAELVSKIHAMRESGATYAQIKTELQVGASTISRVLGVYGKGRRRPTISDDVRARALALRREGQSVPEIARELGIAKSSAWAITKEVAWKPTPGSKERAKRAARMRWDRETARRAEEREQAVSEAAAWVGELSDRELMLIGAVLYWAEGSKTKPWNPTEWLGFINSDPDVILLYRAWLRRLGVADERLTFRVHIHESADVQAAERYWADVVGVSVDRFARATLKKHNPKTVRKNTSEGYYGCLVICARKGAAEYRRMDGMWRGICRAVRQIQ
ncbi:helix-turn-helix domain-containing protein [Phytoactinopolyspora mesophila]|uniref:Uncharacterized protein n=1 Tax=Phytoactinopolyspora mesophila TaxID=2650750 RepID=A0A7K3M598_9ACTN|nr:helix-turn-helix domain-containing protein [Phytoactinopolyspora mesophila]NDL58489.1 hypothetical protein [Phytoactinopolyspora mesophila]